MNRRLTLAAAAALLALTGCGGNGKPTSVASAETVVSPTPPAATGKPTTSPAPPPTSPKAGTSTPTGPQIVYFRIKSVKCQSYGQSVTYPGVVELEWKVTGADKVSISIDGPGIYRDDYPTTHQEQLSFTCEETPGKTTKHTYLLRTIGGGPVREAKVVGEAKFY